MKRIITTAVFLLVIVSFIIAGHSHGYHITAYSTATNTLATYDGARVRVTQKADDAYSTAALLLTLSRTQSFSYTFYGLGSGSSISDEAWNYYVNSGYRLIYMGGNYYFSDSDSWSENGNISSYLYPSYLDYLRP